MSEFNVHEKTEVLREEVKSITKQVRQQITGYLTAALGVVAGIAWNDAIKATIDYFIPPSKNSLMARFLYALIVTVVVVFLTVYLIRILKGRQENKEMPSGQKGDSGKT